MKHTALIAAALAASVSFAPAWTQTSALPRNYGYSLANQGATRPKTRTKDRIKSKARRKAQQQARRSR